MPTPSILRPTAIWQNLRFYQKSEVLYQLTVVFCKRFLPATGDRTVDQMVQAARSGKQNIVEGSEDGKTSTEMELKLLNVARASIGELKEDYKDFILSHQYPLWDKSHPRFAQLQAFTKQHNRLVDYLPYVEVWTAEEFANTMLTLCYQMDAMLNHYLQKQEKEFVTQGGIKERMYAARTGYRQEQDALLLQLQQENESLRQTLSSLQKENATLRQENALLLQEITTLRSPQ